MGAEKDETHRRAASEYTEVEMGFQRIGGEDAGWRGEEGGRARQICAALP